MKLSRYGMPKFQQHTASGPPHVSLLILAVHNLPTSNPRYNMPTHAASIATVPCRRNYLGIFI